MPVISVWLVPTIIAVGVTQYYLMALASLVEAALAVARPVGTSLIRRGKFNDRGREDLSNLPLMTLLCARRLTTMDRTCSPSLPRPCCCFRAALIKAGDLHQARPVAITGSREIRVLISDQIRIIRHSVCHRPAGSRCISPDN